MPSSALTSLVVLVLLTVGAFASPPAVGFTAEASGQRQAKTAKERQVQKAKRCRRARAGRQRTRVEAHRRTRSGRCQRKTRRRPPFVGPAPSPPAPPRLVGAREAVAPLPAGTRLFSPTGVWNAPLARGAPLDPDSERLVAALAGEVRAEVASNIGPWITFDQYSTPIYTVGEDFPTVRVALDANNLEFQRDLDAVPIPPEARAARGSDQHLSIYQPATDTLWELWIAHRRADGWHAAWGGKMTGVSRNPGYFSGSFGATATGLPLMGGLMTIEELKALRIDHALALSVPNTAAEVFTWPAQRGDGRTAGPTAIPQGTRFRIDPSLDLARLGLSPLGLAMARAVQTYGMIVRDTAGCVCFYGEDPAAAPGRPYDQIFGGAYPNHLLRGFPWDRLQVVGPRAGS